MVTCYFDKYIFSHFTVEGLKAISVVITLFMP